MLQLKSLPCKNHLLLRPLPQFCNTPVCSPGFGNNAGSCTQCALGQYSAGGSAVACGACGTGTTTAAAGSVSAADCDGEMPPGQHWLILSMIACYTSWTWRANALLRRQPCGIPLNVPIALFCFCAPHDAQQCVRQAMGASAQERALFATLALTLSEETSMHVRLARMGSSPRQLGASRRLNALVSAHACAYV
jgi:Tyrosine-protein kinase ephrin type A/B receptor-like